MIKQLKEVRQLDRQKLKEIIMDFFDVPNNTYTYNLTRVKEAFEIGTMSLDDFEEIDESNIDELVDYIIANYN